MTTHVWVLSVALAVAALLSWGALLREDHELSRVTRPTYVVLVIGLLWSLHTEDPVPRIPTPVPLLVALSAALVGDVLLLHQTRPRYRLGLFALVVATGCLVWATIALLPAGTPWAVVPAVLAVGLVQGRAGRHIVRCSGSDRGIVLLSLAGLYAFVAVAAWRADWVVLGAAVLLLASQLVLGHDRVVHERRLAPVVSLALFQAALVTAVLGFLL